MKHHKIIDIPYPDGVEPNPESIRVRKLETGTALSDVNWAMMQILVEWEDADE